MNFQIITGGFIASNILLTILGEIAVYILETLVQKDLLSTRNLPRHQIQLAGEPLWVRWCGMAHRATSEPR